MLSVKRSRWIVRVAVVGVLVLMLLIAAIMLISTDVQAQVSVLVVHSVATVQPIPTEEATVTMLNKQKLVDEVQQLREQNEPDFLGWLRSNASLLLSTLVVVIGGLVGLWRWLGDRRDMQDKVLKDQQNEREKRAEERFQVAVTGLGDEKEGARIGAAILLRTFLRDGYEQFYTQVFDLAVANLRRRGTSKIAQHQLWDAPQNLDTTLSLTTLDQALIVVFKEAFALARDQEKRESRFLDATGVQLDNAYLVKADLKQFWGPQASLRKADLTDADLRGADLSGADLSGADLSGANLSGASLIRANFFEVDLQGADLRGAILAEVDLSMANLNRANLTGVYLQGALLIGARLFMTDLRGADLQGAFLVGANLSETNLSEVNLSRADLSGAILSGANLSGANLTAVDLIRANLSGANLNRTNLSGAEGLTKERRAAYRAQGALVDEEPESNVSQKPVSTSSPLGSKITQPLLSQETSPAPDADQDNGMSSHPASDQGTPEEAEKGDGIEETHRKSVVKETVDCLEEKMAGGQRRYGTNEAI